MTLQNATSAQVEYVLAADGAVFDSFQVTQPAHGPFPNATRTRVESENPGPPVVLGKRERGGQGGRER